MKNTRYGLMPREDVLVQFILNKFPAWIWLVNKVGQILYCNPQIMMYFDYKEEQLVGKSVFDFLAVPKVTLMRDFHEQVLLNGGSAPIALLNQIGEKIAVTAKIEILNDQGILYYLIMCSDLPEIDLLTFKSGGMEIVLPPSLSESKDYRSVSGRKTEEIENIFSFLLKSTKKHDFCTYLHMTQVFHKAYEFGRYLNLSREDQRILKIAALLHDIGKVRVNLKVLNKTGNLLTDEFEILKFHPENGALLVKKYFPQNMEIAEIVLYHHERYDGKGYPHGLVGENSPYLSRILQIVDAYCAMRHHRPYREKLSEARTIQQIYMNRATQFDPVLADQFILFSADIYKRKKMIA